MPQPLIDAIRGVDLIIHAGDINKDYVIYELEELARVEYVLGNTDDSEEWVNGSRQKIISAEGCKIGIIHGDGSGGTTPDRVKRAFAGQDVACVVFGHSHIPFNEVSEGVLFFNPGSPTDKRRQKQFSYGMLTVDGGSITGEIIYF